MRRRAWLAFPFALALLGAGEPAREVGFVESFRGDAAGYALLRGGERVPVSVLAPLQAGDVVSVSAPDGRIELRLGGGPATVLEAGAAPFRVEAAGGEATVSMNVVRWLSDFVRGRAGAEPGAGVSLVTRGAGALGAPLLADGMRLVAGSRSGLALAWSGGTPPYRVELADAAGRPLAALESAGVAASLDAFVLPAGAFTLRVVDAGGTSVTARGEALAAAPAAPAALGADAFAPPLRETLGAAWLAGQEGGAWRLEAYQRAATAGDYAPARALRDALAAGDAPPPLAADGNTGE